MSELKITFLGTGTSQGIPVIACDCPTCLSKDPKDNRLRTSIMLSFNDRNLVIDTGPDFRQQMLRHEVKMVDAILFTHEHKDHIAGMDDIRAFNFRAKRDMEIYATEAVQLALKREFYYVFMDKKYPGIPQVDLNLITDKPFTLFGEKIIPIDVLHYQLPVKAFRVRDFTYITDANYISEEELEKIKGSKIIVVNALRKEKHISHFNLDEALALIAKLKPEKAYLTHISHLMGLHEEVSRELPENVSIAYDGLEIVLS
ncbi:MBL fold metallo-hydrolase [Paracrocinitomix mangrovi]|uniref:MBL fold metallo-hydrolase n=1 Tax=Paracrocinitomix mangrovi TaxID=2862509 RepID=UPI001C8E231C|nr:MBL fold metallo-hydrolase [Paracrocinitomix mangrovi]UKN02667.1 MBL fold metallo-hydrolase [Paracrocinitomix mangrovi]